MRHQTGTTDSPNTRPGWRARVVNLVRSWFGINTLRGRFLYMACLLLALLVVMAWMVSNRVLEVSGDNAANLTDRHRVSALTHSMSNAMWEAELDLQHYMLQPAAAKRERFATILAGLINDSEQLAQTAWARRSSGMRARLESQLRDLRQLRAEGLRLMEIRYSPLRAFPAMPIMIDRMQPHNDGFIAIAALAIDEAKEHVSSPGQLEALQLFYDSLYSWSRMIDAFRLYVSNRFGIFDVSPEAAMGVQAAITEEFSKRILANLARLAELDRRGLLPFEQSSALENMQSLHRQWHKAWREVQTIWASESWRLDTQLLQNSVTPLFAGVWKSVREIETEVAPARSRICRCWRRSRRASPIRFGTSCPRAGRQHIHVRDLRGADPPADRAGWLPSRPRPRGAPMSRFRKPACGNSRLLWPSNTCGTRYGCGKTRSTRANSACTPSSTTPQKALLLSTSGG